MAENPSPRQPPPLVPADQEDPDTDRNFDYTQQPDADGEGVPVSEWMPEQPFDSSDWMDMPEPKYSDPKDEEPGDPEPDPDDPNEAREHEEGKD